MNVLIQPSVGNIAFDNNNAGSNSVGSGNSSLSFNASGGLTVTSTNTSNNLRFAVSGINGNLFSVNDSLTGQLFSVNAAGSIPVFQVYDTGSTVIGPYGTNTLLVSGVNVSIGGPYVGGINPPKLTVYGTVSSNNTIYNNIPSNNWSYQFQNNGNNQSGFWMTNYGSGQVALRDSIGNLVSIDTYNVGGSIPNAAFVFSSTPKGGSYKSLITILTSGNVGIGTSQATNPLQVVGTTYSTTYIAGGANSSTSRIQGASMEWSRNVGDGSTWFINQQGSGNGGWYFAQANTSNQITLTAVYINGATGNMGIGTNSPTSKLHVNGDVKSTNTAKAWVNFNGATIANDYTNGNSITYTSATSAVTATRSSHTVSIGDWITVSGITGITGPINGTYQVNSVSSTAFAYTVPFTLTGTAGGTAVIRVATIKGTPYNVSSIAKNGTGDYTVNFTNSLTDANYSALVSTGTVSTSGVVCSLQSLATNNFRFLTLQPTGPNYDQSIICATVFGN
jgi:hypothetical protein